MEYAFVTSPYPVVLSIENHCNFENQQLMASIMIETFKDCLAYPMKSTAGKNLPSPKELMRKILIKGKRAKTEETEEKLEDEEKDEDEEDDEALEQQTDAGQSTIAPSTVVPRAVSIHKSVNAEPQAPKRIETEATHPDLSAITYLGTMKIKKFTPQLTASTPCDIMSSFGETKLPKLMKTPERMQLWIEHNKNHFR